MHWQYLKAVLRHKWFVLLAGLGSVPLWRLLVHDWTKFIPAEWAAYARAFYSAEGKKPEGKAAFNRAWLHHQKFNLHHWQYWVMLEDSGKVYALEMPEVYRRELVADWKGANRAYGDMSLKDWYEKTLAGRILHTRTRHLIERDLGYAHCAVCGLNQEPCVCEVNP